MLTKWHLNNFKAFAGPVDIELAPLTLFMGANSSGKSTILQTILLIKQTLQYATVDKPLALNGPLLRLGDFQDVVSDRTLQKTFSLGWTLRGQNAEGGGANADPWSPDYVLRSAHHLREVSTHMTFGRAIPETLKSQSSVEVSLTNASLEATFTDDDQEEQQLRISISQGLESSPGQLTLQPSARSGPRRLAEPHLYRVDDINAEARAELLSDRPNGTIAGVQLRNFFPSTYVIQYDENERRIRSIIAHILGTTPWFRLTLSNRASELPRSAVAKISAWIDQTTKTNPRLRVYRPQPDANLPSNVRELAAKIRPLLARLRDSRVGTTVSAASELHELETILDSSLRAQPSKASIGFDTDTVGIANEASELARTFFETKVRYLGPLRDDPRPLYPIEGVAALDDVGYRGEHTAAVLDANRHKTITYVKPANTFDDHIEIATGTLQEGVIEWLIYLGVAESVWTLDRGKLGHELKVQSQAGGQLHDLTNVGVGVSQVLPIVVMALIAEPGSTLIFEQPELHLHPKVQTRLADFFISMCFLGKQCLLETHSEYMVHRLRLRVAQDNMDRMTNLIRLYFIEREQQRATCRDVEINQYGAIVEWPKDFFDQSQEEIESILQAATAKARLLRATPKRLGKED